jgi:hypothetical protein
MISQPVDCLPPSSSSIHELKSRLEKSIAKRDIIVSMALISSSEKLATSNSSRPDTALLRETETSSSSSRDLAAFVFAREVVFRR